MHAENFDLSENNLISKRNQTVAQIMQLINLS